MAGPKAEHQFPNRPVHHAETPAEGFGAGNHMPAKAGVSLAYARREEKRDPCFRALLSGIFT